MTFITNDLTKDDLWVYELAHIPEELRDLESELRTTRWFDYRDKLPIELTQIFTEEYIKMYRGIYGSFWDYESADKIKVTLTQNDLLSLTQARQGADKIGCPYSFYIRFAMMRTYERAWKYIPRPNQLYGEELILDAKDNWESSKRDVLFLAESDFYKLKDYKGHPDQDDYHRYLLDMVKLRATPAMILARLIFREKCLSEELAIKHFGGEVFTIASNHFHAV